MCQKTKPFGDDLGAVQTNVRNIHELLVGVVEREYVSSVFPPSGVAFRFDLASDVENDIGIKIETVLVVSTAALTAVPVSPP